MFDFARPERTREGIKPWHFTNSKVDTGELHDGVEFEQIGHEEDVRKNKFTAHLLDDSHILLKTPSLGYHYAELNAVHQQMVEEMEDTSEPVNTVVNTVVNAVMMEDVDGPRSVTYFLISLPKGFSERMTNEVYSSKSVDGKIDYMFYPIAKVENGRIPHVGPMSRIRWRVSFIEEITRCGGNKTPGEANTEDEGAMKMQAVYRKLQKMTVQG